MNDQALNKSVNIRPGVAMLSVLSHLNYQPWYALAEFVDNALQSYLNNKERLLIIPGAQPRVRVDIILEDDHLSVRDDAAGIALSDFPRAFRAASVPPDRTQLAEFGIGMKAAACWFSSLWRVRTKALGERVERSVRFDIDRIVKDSMEDLEIHEEHRVEWMHYTVVDLLKLHRPMHGRTVGKIKEHLAEIYREFFRTGELELFFNGEQLKYEEPKILVAPYYQEPHGSPREWRTEINLDFGLGLKVRGFAAILERAKSSGAGFALFRRRRLIQGGSDRGYLPERLFGKPNDFRYQRVFGELHLDGFKVTHTKDGIVWDEYEDDFLELLDDHLRDATMPLLQQAKEHRVRKVVADIRAIGQEATSKTAVAVGAALPAALAQARADGPSDEFQEQLPAAKESSNREVSVLREGVTWIIVVELAYDTPTSDWLQLAEEKFSKDRTERRLRIRLSMSHPFMEQFCATDQDQIEGFLRVAAALAVGETIARDIGVESAGTVRREVNNLLRDALAKR